MENKLKQHLLGNLPETDAEEVDLQIISGIFPEEELYQAEDDLMEDYLDGTLSPAECELFHKNFLISDERQSALKHFSLLKSYAQNTVRSESSNGISNESSDNFFQRLRKLVNLNLRALTAACAFVILGLAVGLFFYVSGGSEVAEMNKKDLSNLSEFRNFSSISLTPGVFRDSGGAKNLSVGELTDRVLFRLTLPVEVNSARSFDVKIIKEQRIVTTLGRIHPYENQSGSELRLLLPSSLLEKGDYKIEVAPENAKNIIITYPLTVR